ncbi:Cholera toxin secretion protein epsF [Fusobacterium necrogenes]|uniref:Cholera toxin secretion protein epsF n=1 Tax=Fusobacterium necrogenes TaxID=858 RepID=A0A377GUU1_9FUSO|nr:type II secretion system F family protein [Fusobacterium necrogenes]STO30709.1 Cholera toxin secretion protein epsF [Fusobacterium necrogenes]
MKFYSFKVYDSQRKKLSYLIGFDSSKDFHNYLKKNKLILISYKIITPKYKILQSDILNFTKNFKTLLESGLTISTVLDILSSQEKNNIFSSIINDIKNKILNGKNIYLAFLEYRDVFGDTYLNLLLVGEESGQLLKNLDKICENIILKEKIKRDIKEAMLYPSIVFVFAILLLFFMLIFVFPSFISLFKNTNTKLPLLTEFIIFLSENILYILLIIFFLITGIILFFKKISLEKSQNLKLKFPLYGKIIKKSLLINLTQNFSIMSEVGINIIDILESLKKATPYIFLQYELQEIQSKIKVGNSIEEAFSLSSLLNSNQLDIISVGEKTGKLSDAFASISFIEQKELEAYLFKLTTFLQPILLLTLGIIIGIIILAIYLPIFNISEIII